MRLLAISYVNLDGLLFIGWWHALFWPSRRCCHLYSIYWISLVSIPENMLKWIFMCGQKTRGNVLNHLNKRLWPITIETEIESSVDVIVIVISMQCDKLALFAWKFKLNNYLDLMCWPKSRSGLELMPLFLSVIIGHTQKCIWRWLQRMTLQNLIIHGRIWQYCFDEHK